MYNRYCCCVFRKAIGFKPTCIYRVTKLCGGIRALRGVSLVCIIVTIVPKYSVNFIRSFSAFQVEDVCCVGEHFFICVHRPTNSLAACTHMHTQKCITETSSSRGRTGSGGRDTSALKRRWGKREKRRR